MHLEQRRDGQRTLPRARVVQRLINNRMGDLIAGAATGPNCGGRPSAPAPSRLARVSPITPGLLDPNQGNSANRLQQRPEEGRRVIVLRGAALCGVDVYCGTVQLTFYAYDALAGRSLYLPGPNHLQPKLRNSPAGAKAKAAVSRAIRGQRAIAGVSIDTDRRLALGGNRMLPGPSLG